MTSTSELSADENSLWFLGDCHGRLEHIVRALKIAPKRPQAVIFLGDMGVRQPFDQAVAPIETLGVAVWFIHGNHDSDDMVAYQHLFNSTYADRNLHGKVVEIAGVRVAGLGGVFRGSVWYPQHTIRETCHFDNYATYVEVQKDKWPDRLREGNQALITSGKLLLHRSTIFMDDWEQLGAERADVLVTHEAPSCHPNGFVALDELGRCLGVKAAFHGHHHDSLDYRPEDERLGFRAYGIGLRGISNLAGNCIRPGDVDARKMRRQK
jgi:predicted phosphodiesterase